MYIMFVCVHRTDGTARAEKTRFFYLCSTTFMSESNNAHAF